MNEPQDDAELDPADTQEPAEGEPPEQQQKLSQQQANYRMGSPQRSCGLCACFTGSAGPGAYGCTEVEGKISPYGYSDRYARQDNPFLPGEQAAFTAEEAPDDEGAPGEAAEPPTMDQPAPGLRIGNRSYG